MEAAMEPGLEAHEEEVEQDKQKHESKGENKKEIMQHHTTTVSTSGAVVIDSG